jgi:hypothetical protein
LDNQSYRRVSEPFATVNGATKEFQAYSDVKSEVDNLIVNCPGGTTVYSEGKASTECGMERN